MLDSTALRSTVGKFCFWRANLGDLPLVPAFLNMATATLHVATPQQVDLSKIVEISGSRSTSQARTIWRATQGPQAN